MRILYFASLRERLGRDQETLDPPESVRTLGDLKAWLASRGEPWSELFNGSEPVLGAVNQAMAQDDTPVGADDEVGFFPPVTGG